MKENLDYNVTDSTITAINDLIKDFNAEYLKCLAKKKFKLGDTDSKILYYQYNLRRRLLRNYLPEFYDCLEILAQQLLPETIAYQVSNSCFIQKLCLEGDDKS